MDIQNVDYNYLNISNVNWNSYKSESSYTCQCFPNVFSFKYPQQVAVTLKLKLKDRARLAKQDFQNGTNGSDMHKLIRKQEKYTTYILEVLKVITNRTQKLSEFEKSET